MTKHKRAAGIDVDGVLAALTPHILECVGGRVKPEEIVTWNIENYLTDDERAVMFKLWNDPEWWQSIPVLDGAREGVEHIRSAGYEVLAVTSPFHTCKGWENARREWLGANFEIAPSQVIVIPSERKERYHVDLFVDDKLETVDAWSRRWIGMSEERAFLFDAPYNRHNKETDPPWDRLRGWAAIGEFVQGATR